MIDVEELRNYCLSLSVEVTEKFPFVKFKSSSNVLAFYIGGHMFCYFDITDLTRVTMKSDAALIEELRAQHDCIGKPYNGNPRYWIGVDATRADVALVKRLVAESFAIVSKKK